MSSGSTCYYPNGNPSQGDIPCGSGDGVACCPQGWSCEPNGLCHLPQPFFYGRYTCTDKTWKSKGCPNICTHGNTAAGAEAVLECSSGSYCCDANRPELASDNSVDQSKDCCHTSNDRFPLAQLPLAPGGPEDSNGSGGSASASGSASSPSAAPSTSSSSSSSSASATQSTATPSTTSSNHAASSSSTTSAQPSTIISVITQSGGGSSTLTTTTSNTGSAAPASATPSPLHSSSPSSKNIGSIIGPAVAAPIAVLLLVILAFFLFRRRRRRQRDQTRASSPPPRKDTPQPMYGYDAKGLVDSPHTGKSELEGSSTNPNTPVVAAFGMPGNDYHTPNDVGTAGNRRSTKSELAASNSTTTRTPKSRLSELHESPRIGEASEGEEGGQQPAELQGDEAQGGTYKPYRPPGLGLT